MENIPDEKIDELLELIWIMREEGIDSAERIKAEYQDGDADALIEVAAAQGLISQQDDRLTLKHAGSDRASGIIRRHRLAETLLTEILELDESTAESEACRFEHILSQAATESVCTLLGHPPACPHGKLIPRGSCCAKFKKHLSPLVVPLTELNPGEQSRIVFIAPKSHARLDRLATLGIVAGSIVKLHQKQPACILQVDETNVAIDPDIAGEIFVRRL